MAIGDSVRRHVRALFGRTAREEELDEEIRFHLEAAEAQHRARGLSPDEARRAARLDFGGVERAKEEVRDTWALAWVSEIGRDVRLALRGFRKRPAYAATVVVTLALAIGAAGAIFAALFAIVIRPLPFAADGSLVEIRQMQRGSDQSVGLSPLEVADYREATRSLEGIAEYHSMGFTLLGHGEPRQVRVGVVSANYFRLLGVEPTLGRDFVPEDDGHAAAPVLLLTHRFWRGELGGDPAIVGADFTMNDRIHTVVGVLPPLPAFPDELDVYMPVHACPFRSSERWAEARTSRGLNAIARLREGYDVRAAASDLETIASRLASAYPAAYPDSLSLRPRLVPLREAVTVGARPTLWLLVGAVVAVLLLVLANLMNLTLAQLARRQGELAMRVALGGSRAQIARPLATEGCILALLGGGLGLLLAFACQGLLAGFLGRLTPRAAEIRLDLTTVLVVLGLSLAVGLLIGLVPALRRPAALSSSLLSDGAKTTSGRPDLRVRDALVVVQVAASFVLLIGAGLLLESLWNLERVSPGFAHSEVIAVGLPLNWTKYARDEDQLVYARKLLQAVQATPGVQSAAISDTYPLNSDLPWNRRVAIGKAAPDPATPGPTADFRTVSPGYFATIGVPIVAGRALTDADDDPKRAVALINQALARKLFPDRDPLGQEVIFSHGTTSWTIVGITADVRQHGLAVAPQPELYAPLALTAGGGRLLVRAPHAGALMPSLRRAIRSIDPDQPITEVRTLAEARAESLAGPRATAALLAIAAVLALAIAAAGLAGLLAYSLGGRQREFGIRLALGATKLDVARLVLRRTGTLVAVGVVLGLLGARMVASGLDSMLFGLAAGDPGTYVIVGMVLVATAFVACLPSLRRAIATEPSISLRSL